MATGIAAVDCGTGFEARMCSLFATTKPWRRSQSRRSNSSQIASSSFTPRAVQAVARRGWPNSKVATTHSPSATVSPSGSGMALSPPRMDGGGAFESVPDAGHWLPREAPERLAAAAARLVHEIDTTTEHDSQMSGARLR